MASPKTASKRKQGGVFTFPPYEPDELKKVSAVKEPHPAEAFVILWNAIVRTEEKVTETSDLDLWLDVRRKLRKLEQTISEMAPDPFGKMVENETIVCISEGGDLVLTGPELALVTRLWEGFRSRMSLAQGERRAMVDEMVYNPKSRVVAEDGGAPLAD